MAGDLDGALELARGYLAQIEVERERAEAAARLVEHWAERRGERKQGERLQMIRVLCQVGYGMAAILRMLLYLDGGGRGDVRDILDSPPPDEEIFYVTDRWLSTLAAQEERAREAIALLEAMMAREERPSPPSPLPLASGERGDAPSGGPTLDWPTKVVYSLRSRGELRNLRRVKTLPRVVVHNAASVDGRTTGFEPDLGLYYGLAARWQADAMLSGADTILAAPEGQIVEAADDPLGPTPDRDRTRCLLVISDSRGRLRCWQAMRDAGYWRDVVALCSHSTPGDYLDYLGRRRVDYILAGDDHVDLGAALEELSARYGIKLVRVDSGGTLNGALLRAGPVDEVSVLIHPSLVGGTSPRSMYRSRIWTGRKASFRSSWRTWRKWRTG